MNLRSFFLVIIHSVIASLGDQSATEHDDIGQSATSPGVKRRNESPVWIYMVKEANGAVRCIHDQCTQKWAKGTSTTNLAVHKYNSHGITVRRKRLNHLKLRSFIKLPSIT